jgi:protein TonB
MISIAAHAFAAVAARVVLPMALRGEAQEIEIEVDLAHTDLIGPSEQPRPAPLTAPTGQNPAASRKATHPRKAAESAPRRIDDLPFADCATEVKTASIPEDQTPSPRFTLPAGIVGTQPLSPGPVMAGSHAGAESGKGRHGVGEAVAERDVSVAARLISSGPVAYPPEARRAEVETDVPVQILVDSAGRVLEARSLSHQGYGLDEAAEQAIRTWRFSPALRDERPVRVRMLWTVQFRLR